EQQAAIAKGLRELGPRWIAILQAAKGNQQEIHKKVGELNRGLVADILKGMTPDQQAKWGQLTGPPLVGVMPVAAPFVRMLVPPRPQPVLKWHMNDLAAAQAEARQTGKPIFVTFRCEA